MRLFIRLSIVVSLLVLIFSVSVSASESSALQLDSKQLKEALLNDVGLDEEALKFIPEEIQQELVEEGAKLVATNGVQTFHVTEPDGSDDSINDASIAATLNIYGSVYSVTSDRPGYKKFRMFGDFSWVEDPNWRLTDGFSIGYPVTTKFFVPTSGGKIQQFESRHCGYRINGNGSVCSETNTPARFEPGAGVGANISLSGTRTKENGYVSQYVYVEDTESGTTNVLFRYGHKTISGSVGFSVYPAGLAVTPTSTTTVYDYVVTLRY